MEILSLTEQVYLTAIICNGDNAYGVKIREKVIEITGKSMAFGTLYNNLDQLVRKGFVTAGKDLKQTDSKKVFYKLTDSGKAALKNSRNLQESLWSVVPDDFFAFDQGNNE